MLKLDSYKQRWNIYPRLGFSYATKDGGPVPKDSHKWYHDINGIHWFYKDRRYWLTFRREPKWRS